MELEQGSPRKEQDPETTKPLFILDMIINNTRGLPNEADGLLGQGGMGQAAARAGKRLWDLKAPGLEKDLQVSE